jgi:hypothetical protein
MKFLPVAVLALGASIASAAHFSRAAGRFDCPGIGNSHNCAISIEASLRVPFLHRVDKGRLNIDIMNGQVHSFVDVDVEGDTAVYYHALEVSKTSRYVLIHLQRYEWSEYGLLDRRSGIFTKFAGYPVFSPDEHWLAVVDGHENAEPVFQILELAGNDFRLAFDATPDKWWPTQVKWTSATSLTYGRTALSAGPKIEVTVVPKKLQLDGRTWR